MMIYLSMPEEYGVFSKDYLKKWIKVYINCKNIQLN
jgi:hypothetical protein